MGLFDNLFLDANTPVTINDGVDHSKDIVAPIADPKSASVKGDDEKGGVKDAKDDTVAQKDGALSDLFGTAKAEEEAAEKILSPEPPPDIALEIGLGHISGPSTTVADTPISVDAAVSFDIGGDVSFDIGGDMTMGEASSPTGEAMVSGLSTVENTEILPEVIKTSESSFISHESGEAPAVTAIENPTNEVQLDAPVIDVLDASAVTSENTSDTQAVPENALFSLLNEEDTHTEAVESAVEEIPVSSDISAPVVSDSLFDMMAEQDAPVENKTSENSGASVSPISLESAVPISHETLDDTHISASAPKLRQKLSEFLSELETMEVGDETTKAHKLDQIRMCETRIAEIESESHARISALQHEIAALKREIEDMDKEKTHIKNVIETFQKELETA